MTRSGFYYAEELCRACLEDEEDVAVIRNLARQLPLIADLMDANVYIDCPMEEPNTAMVVAEAFPTGEEPLYKNTPVGSVAHRANEPAALRTLSLGVISRGLFGVSQESFPIKQVTVPVFGKDPSKPIGVLIRESRVNDQEKAEQKLAFIQEAASGFTDAVYGLELREFGISEQIKEAVILFDDSGHVTYRNNGAVKLYQSLGYQQDLHGKSFENIVLTKDSFADCLKGICEVRELTVGNLSLEVKYSTNSKNERDRVCMLIHDVTGGKERERKLRLQSFLISEMNHRIKNNLQMVASLLNIQASGIQSPEVKQMFYESVNRVRSIAEVHNQLSICDGADIEILALSRQICANISGLSELEYCVSGERVYISASKASAFGLVINELVQNVVKHAHPPEGKKKKVIISVSASAQYINVEMMDNGTGFPKELTRNLGLQLVQRLLREPLNGRLEIKNKEKNSIISLVFSQ